MSPAKRFLPPLITLIAVLAAVMLWRMSVSTLTTKVSPEQSSALTLTAQSVQSPNSATGDATNEKSAPPVLFTPDELSVQKLQNLLDDESKHQEALDRALAMATGSIREQLAAIDAFRWLGGRKAMQTLINMRSQGYEAIADEAGNVLSHLLTENMYSGGMSRDDIPDDGLVILDEGLYDDELNDDDQRPDKDLWLQAIQEAPTEAARDELLIILAAYPVDQAMPVLLQLLDSPDGAVRDAAKDHLQSITGGDEILTREQGEEWLAKNSSPSSAQAEPVDLPE